MASREEGLSNEEVGATAEGDVEKFTENAVKVLGSGRRKERGRGVDFEKIALGGCAGFAGNGSVVVSKGVFEVAAHGNGNVAGGEESDVHAQELMGVTTSRGEGAEFGLQLVDDMFNDGGFDVSDHGVVDVPSDGAL